MIGNIFINFDKEVEQNIKIINVKIRISFLLLIGLLISASSNAKGQNNKGYIKIDIKSLDNWIGLMYYKPLMENGNSKKKLIRLNKKLIKVKMDTNLYHRVVIISRDILLKPRLVTKAKRIQCYIRPGDTLNIKGTLKDTVNDYYVTGNALSAQYSDWREHSLDILEWQAKINVYLLQIKDLKVPSDRKRYKELNKKWENSVKRLHESDMDFIRKHPDYLYSVDRLRVSRLPLDTLIKYYKRFDPILLDTYYGRRLNKSLAYKKQKEKNELIDFQATTINDEPYRLLETEKDYIVLDFWASWCGPCIDDIPKLRSYHEKANGLIEFVGVNCDKKLKRGISTIQKHNMNWTQVGNKNERILKLYGVSEIPTKILINVNEGTIERFIGLDNNFYKRLDMIINTNNRQHSSK